MSKGLDYNRGVPPGMMVEEWWAVKADKALYDAWRAHVDRYGTGSLVPFELPGKREHIIVEWGFSGRMSYRERMRARLRGWISKKQATPQGLVNIVSGGIIVRPIVDDLVWQRAVGSVRYFLRLSEAQAQGELDPQYDHAEYDDLDLEWQRALSHSYEQEECWNRAVQGGADYLLYLEKARREEDERTEVRVRFILEHVRLRAGVLIPRDTGNNRLAAVRRQLCETLGRYFSVLKAAPNDVEEYDYIRERLSTFETLVAEDVDACRKEVSTLDLEPRDNLDAPWAQEGVCAVCDRRAPHEGESGPVETESETIRYLVPLAHRFPSRRLVVACSVPELKQIIRETERWGVLPYFMVTDAQRVRVGREGIVCRMLDRDEPEDILIDTRRGARSSPRAQVWLVEGYLHTKGYVHCFRTRIGPRLWLSSEPVLAEITAREVEMGVTASGYSRYSCRQIVMSSGLSYENFPREAHDLLIARAERERDRVAVRDLTIEHACPGFFYWSLAVMQVRACPELWVPLSDGVGGTTYRSFYLRLCARFRYGPHDCFLRPLWDAIERERSMAEGAEG